VKPLTNDEQVRQAQREARRNHLLAWAWSIVLIPPGVIGYFVLGLAQFTAITVLATWILSVVTLSITQASVAKAAEAKAAGYDNP
jgi:hypothetical protein